MNQRYHLSLDQAMQILHRVRVELEQDTRGAAVAVVVLGQVIGAVGVSRLPDGDGVVLTARGCANALQPIWLPNHPATSRPTPPW